ncbi:glycosyltransferase family 2 protein [Melioribacteraceae bacterium 4301-Me]|uniref:glycosyltransferase family 2 protein n=1 Tax=Pyranulibacter aquaticus TaxID=3163344 RepID=UPI003598B3FB
MSKKNKLSVLIIAGNEEKNIKDCLESVKWADEIVLIDSESKDKTIEIAKQFTDKIFIKKWEGFSPQRKYGLEKVSYDWVLSLDADERVSDELKNEIQRLLNSEPKFDSYLIPRKNFFLGKHITSCNWSPDYQLRLFKKNKASVTNRKVHEGYYVEGERGKLKGKLIHYTHQSIAVTIDKINYYSTLEAQEKFNKKKVSCLDILIHPFAAFFSHFILRRGFKDGIHGLMVSIIHAMTNILTYMKIWEIQNTGNRNMQLNEKEKK